MKKLWTLVCMIACIFGLTACGSEKPLTSYEKEKTDYAKQYVTQYLIPLLEGHATGLVTGYTEEYTAEEVEYYVANQYGVEVDGYGFISAVSSFKSARGVVGEIQSIGDVKATVDGSEIILEVEVEGEKKNAVAEIILTNDMFTRLKSASLNPVSTTGELMIKAAMNTLIGMGTVFIVLILISLIISGFRVIPRLQAASAERKAAKQPAVVQAEPAAAQAEPEETDDLELIAVITAAIAAAEGTVSPDGFVVRSIIRRA